MDELLWYLTRASGIVALALIVAAIADGLIFWGGKAVGGCGRRGGWICTEGSVATRSIFTGLHLVTAFGAGIGVSLASILVPGAAPTSTTAYTLGVVAFYGIAVTVLTTWPKRRLRRKVWHVVHLLSIPAGRGGRRARLSARYGRDHARVPGPDRDGGGAGHVPGRPEDLRGPAPRRSDLSSTSFVGDPVAEVREPEPVA